MLGIELSQLYYAAYGKSMIREKFPEYENRIAVGLVGQGSECFGFDDILSTDHDYGPGFCMWLTKEDYEKIGRELEYEYQQLPKEFKGFKRIESARAGRRIGVFEINDFYEIFVGPLSFNRSNEEWLRIPEKLLATVTNGKVFRDDLGEFTRIREELLKFYPEDVRIKKIVARAAVMAQSGQYNYARCMKRKDEVAASMALNEFVATSISMVHLLNRKYTPYYKWMHRSICKVEKLPQIYDLLEQLVKLPSQIDNWKNLDNTTFFYGINFKDEKVELIEKICALVLEELKNQNLISDTRENFLEAHIDELMRHIKDPRVRCLHVMEG